MKRQRLIRLTLLAYIGMTLSIAVIGLSPIPNLLAKQLYVPPQIVTADCIVLLGGGIMSDGQLSTSSLERTISAAILFRKGFAPKVIVSTGVTLKKPPLISEASSMQKVLVELGIPKSALILEENSTRTAENAREVSHLMKSKGYHNALLVTSDTHMRRSLLSFIKCGTKAYPAPVPSALEKDRSFFTKIRLFETVCHEYLGILYYRLRGWV